MSELPIFKPNNHSNWQIRYEPIHDPLRFNMVGRVVLDSFCSSVDKIFSIEQVCETELNSNNFRVVYANKKGDTVKILVRLYPREKGCDSIQGVIDATKFLGDQGCKVPTIITTDSGNDLIKIANQYATVFQFIEGNHFRGTLAEIENTAFDLGKFDKTLKRLPDAQEIMRKHKLSQKDSLLLSFSADEWQELLAKANQDKSDFGHVLCTYQKLILDSLESVKNLATNKQSSNLFHCDLHPHNLIINGHKLVYFLDMDSLQEMEHVRSLAFGLHRLVRQYIVFQNIDPPNIPKSVEQAKEVFIREYEKNNTLPLEINFMRDVITHEILRRITYVVKSYYLYNDTAWAAELKKQLAFLPEANLF